MKTNPKEEVASLIAATEMLRTGATRPSQALTQISTVDADTGIQDNFDLAFAKNIHEAFRHFQLKKVGKEAIVSGR